MVISSIPEPISVPTKIEGNLPITIKIINNPVGIEEIPANRHKASSGKKGNKNIKNNVITYFSSKIDSYL